MTSFNSGNLRKASEVSVGNLSLKRFDMPLEAPSGNIYNFYLLVQLGITPKCKKDNFKRIKWIP